MGISNNRTLGRIGVTQNGAFHLGRTDAVAAYVDDIVGASGNPKVPGGGGRWRATNGVNVMNGTNEVKRRTTRVKVEGVAKLILNRFFSSPHTRTRPRRAWHDPH